MELNKLTIKAEDIAPLAYHLIQDRLRKRDAGKGNPDLSMAFSNVYARTERKGRIETISSNGKSTGKKGTFRIVWEEIMETGNSLSTCYLDLKDKNLAIELRKYCGDMGDSYTTGVIKTRSHWYERWHRQILKNPEICWA